jgi:upstream activation factor subunit UAF30
MKRFDKFNNERNNPAPSAADPIPTVESPAANSSKARRAVDTSEDVSAYNSHKRSPDDESALSELGSSPPKKKAKKRSTEDEDAAYAAKLQAELNATARSTRGGNTKKRTAAPKKKTKKKSENKVRDEDDSDIVSGSGGEKKEVKRTGGFHVRATPTKIQIIQHNSGLIPTQKPMTLSPPLAELLGETSVRCIHPPPTLLN